MSRILILYSSYDGQTQLIADRLRASLAKAGHQAMLRDAFDAGAFDTIDAHDAVILGAAIRYGHHDRKLEKRVAAHAAQLAARPSAFFSVCLSAGGPGAKPASAKRYIDDFRKRTGWQPLEAESFAGALRYREYNFYIRFMMRLIVGMAGGETDTSRNYEYTDWEGVERFARRFGDRLASRVAA